MARLKAAAVLAAIAHAGPSHAEDIAPGLGVDEKRLRGMLSRLAREGKLRCVGKRLYDLSSPAVEAEEPAEELPPLAARYALVVAASRTVFDLSVEGRSSRTVGDVGVEMARLLGEGWELLRWSIVFDEALFRLST